MLWTYILMSMLGIGATVVASKKESRQPFVRLPYGLPDFAIKLLVLDGGNFSVPEFQTALEVVVRSHLEQSLMMQLPAQPNAISLIGQPTFEEIAVSCVVDVTPVDLLLSDGIPVAVVRAAFEGMGVFNVSRDVAELADIPLDADVLNSTELPKYVGNAFDLKFGFWTLAASIANDTALSRVGKIQIAIDGVIVAEGSLVGEAEIAEEEESTFSVAAMATIGFMIALFATLCLCTVLFVRRHNHEAELERKKLDRREHARKMRRHVRVDSDTPKNDKSDRDGSFNDDDDYDAEAAWMDTKARQVSTVQDRLVKAASAKQARISVPKSKLRSRPALEAKKSNDALLHCIAEEDESSHNDSSSRFMDAHQGSDDVESLYCLLSKSNDECDNSHSSNSSRLWEKGSDANESNGPLNATGKRSTNTSIARPPPEMFKPSFANRRMTPRPDYPSTSHIGDSFEILNSLESAAPSKKVSVSDTKSGALLRHRGDPIFTADESNSDRVIT